MSDIDYLNSNRVWIIFSMGDGVYLLKGNKTEIVELYYGVPRLRKKLTPLFFLTILLLGTKQPVRHILNSPLVFSPGCDIKSVLRNRTIDTIIPIRWRDEPVKWFYTHSL